MLTVAVVAGAQGRKVDLTGTSFIFYRTFLKYFIYFNSEMRNGVQGFSAKISSKFSYQYYRNNCLTNNFQIFHRLNLLNSNKNVLTVINFIPSIDVK